MYRPPVLQCPPPVSQIVRPRSRSRTHRMGSCRRPGTSVSEAFGGRSAPAAAWSAGSGPSSDTESGWFEANRTSSDIGPSAREPSPARQPVRSSGATGRARSGRGPPRARCARSPPRGLIRVARLRVTVPSRCRRSFSLVRTISIRGSRGTGPLAAQRTLTFPTDEDPRSYRSALSRSGGTSQRSVPPPGSNGRADVDPGERTLPHRHPRGIAQDRDQLAEVRIVAHDDRTIRVARGAQDALELSEAEFAAETVVDAHRHTEVTGDDLGRLRGTSLGRGDDRVRPEADPCQEPSEPVGLLVALVRQRPAIVRAVPGEGITGVGMAQEVQLGHGSPSLRDQAPAVEAASRRARSASGMNWLIRSPIWMKTRRKTARRSSSLPVASAGSS